MAKNTVKKIVTGVVAAGTLAFSVLSLAGCNSKEPVEQPNFPENAVVSEVIAAISSDTLLDENIVAINNSDLKYSYEELVKKYEEIKNAKGQSLEDLTKSLNSYIYEMSRRIIPAVVITGSGIDPENVDFNSVELVYKPMNVAHEHKMGIVRAIILEKPEGCENYDIAKTDYDRNPVEFDISLDGSDLDKAFCNTLKAKESVLTVKECDLAQLYLCRLVLSRIQLEGSKQISSKNQVSSELDSQLVDVYNRSRSIVE